MLSLEGMSVSPGYASGTPSVYEYEFERLLEVPRGAISHAEVAIECKRLDGALKQNKQKLDV